MAPTFPKVSLVEASNKCLIVFMILCYYTMSISHRASWLFFVGGVLCFCCCWIICCCFWCFCSPKKEVTECWTDLSYCVTMATQAVFIGILVSFFCCTKPWAGLDVSVVSWCSLGGYIWRFSQRSDLRLHRSARIWYLLKYNYHNFMCFIPNILPWSGLNLTRMASDLMNSFFWESAVFCDSHFAWWRWRAPCPN